MARSINLIRSSILSGGFDRAFGRVDFFIFVAMRFLACRMASTSPQCQAPSGSFALPLEDFPPLSSSPMPSNRSLSAPLPSPSGVSQVWATQASTPPSRVPPKESRTPPILHLLPDSIRTKCERLRKAYLIRNRALTRAKAPPHVIITIPFSAEASPTRFTRQTALAAIEPLSSLLDREKVEISGGRTIGLFAKEGTLPMTLLQAVEKAGPSIACALGANNISLHHALHGRVARTKLLGFPNSISDEEIRTLLFSNLALPSASLVGPIIRIPANEDHDNLYLEWSSLPPVFFSFRAHGDFAMPIGDYRIGVESPIFPSPYQPTCPVCSLGHPATACPATREFSDVLSTLAVKDFPKDFPIITLPPTAFGKRIFASLPEVAPSSNASAHDQTHELPSSNQLSQGTSPFRSQSRSMSSSPQTGHFPFSSSSLSPNRGRTPSARPSAPVRQTREEADWAEAMDLAASARRLSSPVSTVQSLTQTPLHPLPPNSSPVVVGVSASLTSISSQSPGPTSESDPQGAPSSPLPNQDSPTPLEPAPLPRGPGDPSPSPQEAIIQTPNSNGRRAQPPRAATTATKKV